MVQVIAIFCSFENRQVIECPKSLRSYCTGIQDCGRERVMFYNEFTWHCTLGCSKFGGARHPPGAELPGSGNIYDLNILVTPHTPVWIQTSPDSCVSGIDLIALIILMKNVNVAMLNVQQFSFKKWPKGTIGCTPPPKNQSIFRKIFVSRDDFLTFFRNPIFFFIDDFFLQKT